MQKYTHIQEVYIDICVIRALFLRKSTFLSMKMNKRMALASGKLAQVPMIKTTT